MVLKKYVILLNLNQFIMKIVKFVAIAFVLSFFASCNNEDDNGEMAKFAVPEIKSLASIRSSITVTPAQATNADGKVYVAENLLFYVAQESGIHIFDNSIPASPQNTAFINLEGVHDIAVKGNTATNATKSATVETGATVNVPLFINEGDKIKIDTASGSYMERVKE